LIGKFTTASIALRHQQSRCIDSRSTSIDVSSHAWFLQSHFIALHLTIIHDLLQVSVSMLFCINLLMYYI